MVNRSAQTRKGLDYSLYTHVHSTPFHILYKLLQYLDSLQVSQACSYLHWGGYVGQCRVLRLEWKSLIFVSLFTIPMFLIFKKMSLFVSLVCTSAIISYILIIIIANLLHTHHWLVVGIKQDNDINLLLLACANFSECTENC